MANAVSAAPAPAALRSVRRDGCNSEEIWLDMRRPSGWIWLATTVIFYLLVKASGILTQRQSTTGAIARPSTVTLDRLLADPAFERLRSTEPRIIGQKTHVLHVMRRCLSR